MREAKSSYYHLKKTISSKLDKKPEFILPNRHNHSVKEIESLKAKLDEIYSTKYNEHIVNILNQSQVSYMNSLSKDINKLLKEVFNSAALSQSPLNTLIKAQESQLEKKYTKDLKFISSAWNDYQMNAQALMKYSKQLSIKNKETFAFLKRYRKHCSQCQVYAAHTCNADSKLIEITDEEDNIPYVICTECKAVYLASMIKLHCYHCQLDYWSSMLSIDENVDILPATWEKYHCGSVINQTMKCIKCRSTLHLNLKTNFLMCINKGCNFISKPNLIVWNCIVCKKDFYSNAKIFNPSELEFTKKAIKLSLLLQRVAYPNELNCCFDGKMKSESQLAKMTFVHKPECSGVLYKGVLDSKDILVCSQCKAMNYLEKFIWTCPLCKGRFKSMEIGTGVYGMNSRSSKGSSCTTVPLYSRDNSSRGGFSEKKEKEKATSTSKLTPIRNDRRRYKTLIDILEQRDSLFIKKQIPTTRSTIVNDDGNNDEYMSEFNPSTPMITEPSISIYNSSICSKTNKDKEAHKELIQSKDSDNDGSDDNDSIIVNQEYNINNPNSQHILGDTLQNSLSSSSQSKESDLIRISKKSNIPPFSIEDYTLLNSVGEGSFGKIYLIQSKTTKEQFALKKIIAHAIEEVEQYQKEFDLVYSVQHENIMKIFNIEFKLLDFCTYSLYVLMELADRDWSNEITARITCKKYYKEREVIHILKQLTSSLAFLQRKSISHRDIKPQNVLIYKHHTYKVADFGEAKEMKKAKQQQQNTLKGTELYMSPLLYDGLRQNKAEINHNPYKSDVFSLGYCVLYALTLSMNVLTDIREIKDMKTIETIVSKFLMGRYSDELKGLLMMMLEVDEEKRFDFVVLERELEKLN